MNNNNINSYDTIQVSSSNFTNMYQNNNQTIDNLNNRFISYDINIENNVLNDEQFMNYNPSTPKNQIIKEYTDKCQENIKLLYKQAKIRNR